MERRCFESRAHRPGTCGGPAVEEEAGRPGPAGACRLAGDTGSRWGRSCPRLSGQELSVAAWAGDADGHGAGDAGSRGGLEMSAATGAGDAGSCGGWRYRRPWGREMQEVAEAGDVGGHGGWRCRTSRGLEMPAAEGTGATSGCRTGGSGGRGNLRFRRSRGPEDTGGRAEAGGGDAISGPANSVGRQFGDHVGDDQADLIVGVEIAGDVATVGCADEHHHRGTITRVELDRDRIVAECSPVTHMPEFEPASRADPESVEPGTTNGVHGTKFYAACANAEGFRS